MRDLVRRLVPARQRTDAGAACGLLATLVAGFVVGATVGPVHAANKSQLSIYQHDKPLDYQCGTSPLPSRTAVLMGGGLDVKDAFSWMIGKMAPCRPGISAGKGNFVVIRAGGNPAYDSFIYKLGEVASVITLVVPTRESANDPALEPYIRNAGAVFLTGGDQGDYYNFWRGTLLERLVSAEVRNRSIPIGGTSAGMMILSEFAYIADPCTIVSQDALGDPYSQCVALRRDFWTDRTPFPPLLSTVTDSHFDTRDRMGRLVTFLARVIADKWTKASAARAIGVDQETALLMEDSGGSASYSAIANPGVYGAAYVLSAGPGSQLKADPGQALTFTNVRVQKVPAVGGQSAYRIDVSNGVLTSSVGAIY